MFELRHSTLGTQNFVSVTALSAVVLQLLGHVMHALLYTFCSAGLCKPACCHQHNFADLQLLGSLPSPLSTLSGVRAASSVASNPSRSAEACHNDGWCCFSQM